VNADTLWQGARFYVPLSEERTGTVFAEATVSQVGISRASQSACGGSRASVSKKAFFGSGNGSSPPTHGRSSDSSRTPDTVASANTVPVRSSRTAPSLRERPL
jgi:transglutaminase/protease-like cytokinesis protein 3